MTTYVKYIFIFSFVACTLTFTNCKSTKKLAELSEDEIRYSLSKGVCFGSCPVFELTIYQGGYATYKGERNVKNLGLFEKKLEKGVMRKIEKSFVAQDFSSYPDNFESRIPDLPLIKIGFNGDGYLMRW